MVQEAPNLNPLRVLLGTLRFNTLFDIDSANILRIDAIEICPWVTLVCPLLILVIAPSFGAPVAIRTTDRAAADGPTILIFGLRFHGVRQTAFTSQCHEFVSEWELMIRMYC